MYQEDKDVFSVPVNNRIKDLREIAGIIPALCKVFREFDGKVYNVRFDRAINDVSERRIFVDKRSYTIDLYTYLKSSPGNITTIAQFKREDMMDGKRIPADKVIESARSYREKYLQEAYYLESNKEQLYQAREYIRQAVDNLNKYMDSIPYVARELYKIPYQVRTY